MKHHHILGALLIISTLFTVELSQAQQRSVPQSQMFRLAEGIVRIAEPGQLADSVNVWGDVSAPGRYVVPRGTKAHELISYARGPVGFRSGETVLDWSKLRLEVNISRYNRETGVETVQNFSFRYNEPYPEELRQYRLQNDEIISLEIKRRATFGDYMRVAGPVISAAATVLLILDRI